MNTLRMLLDGLTWRHRSIGCVRHGHNLLCDSNAGHLCIRCGRTFPGARL